MQQLLSQLGIDWHLLLSQAVNFFVLLVVLRIFAYKPLLQLLHERKRRIEEGVMKAAEADVRLREAEEMKRGKIKEAETQAMGILKKTESDAKALEERLLGDVKRKEAAEMANLQGMLRSREEESRHAAEKEAVALVRRAIAKTVELAPEKIDDALIARAVEQAKQAA